MNSDLNLYVSGLVLAVVLVQTLFHFRKATRNLLISGTGKTINWVLDRCNRVLHLMLMSPADARPSATKNVSN